ncbi:response regulator transcription factor [Limobrevibacterium gyesilva]|uniref:Response regulator transcription factor n=1 Tax=Limobrevibacterium gyesilva TaxID=2991712 RepID=A0AA42CEX6_9PROT|nr:response regulator transcription factor [Limobrevibacterium gyesilva]MCW3475834.1 response regulator transcription factor [Limobrevibacterium gyesilva]
MRLLLVQGHTAEAQAASTILGATGAVVDHVRTGGDALVYLQTYEYDMIVLDRSLADGEGCDALRRFRAQGFSTPVLMLADYTSGKSRAHALRLGADDLLSKPYDEDEFVARVEAVVRRRNGYARSVLRVGPLEIDMASREVRVDDRPLSVTRKEYSILELMALRKGRVIPKQNFLDHLYSGLDGPETRVIDVFICNLRKKLAAWGLGSLIDTVRGHGYIMRDLADVPADVIPLTPVARFERGAARA